MWSMENDGTPDSYLDLKDRSLVKSSVKELEVTDSKQVPWWTSCRLALGITACLGATVMYSLRINLSLAMVCMVNQTAVLEMTDSSDDRHSINTTGWSVDNGCQVGDGNKTVSMEDGEFIWKKDLQGIIHGSFFWGYLLTQLPGGWLAARFGTKRVIASFELLVVVSTLLVPVAARASPYFLMVLRFLTGVGEGVYFPAMSGLWAKWAPPSERSKLFAIMYSGCQIGNVLALPLSGVLCDVTLDRGWPMIFYVFGVYGVFWFVLWMYVVHDDPSKHPRISDAERKHLERCIDSTHSSSHVPIPWRSIFTSVPVWNLIFCHMMSTYGIYTLLTNTPTYMREVLKVDIKSNGILNAIAYLAFGLSVTASGVLADKMIAVGLSVKNTRRICFTLGHFVAGVFLVGTGHVPCGKEYLAVILLVVAMTFCGIQFSVVVVNCVDIAPQFAGIIFGIQNTAGTLSGIVAPYVTAKLTENQTQAQWRNVFYITGAIYTVGTIIFCIFLEAEVQDWANPTLIKDGKNRNHGTKILALEVHDASDDEFGPTVISKASPDTSDVAGQGDAEGDAEAAWMIDADEKESGVKANSINKEKDSYL